MYIIRDSDNVYFLHARQKQKGKEEQYELKTAIIRAKELEARTGLTQQAISRFETGRGGSIKTLLKYAEGIDCKLMPQSK